MAGILLPGDATPDNVLITKKFSAGTYYGAGGQMANIGSPTITPTNVDQNLSVGYYSGGVVGAGFPVRGTITDAKLIEDTLTGRGSQVWQLTTPTYARCVKVGPDGYIYAGHSGSGVRKYNDTPTLQWNNIEVDYVSGIDVDASGNVYLAHYKSTGRTVRKLNSSGVEQWSNSDKTYANCVILDSAGNVYAGYNSGLKKFNNSGVVQWSLDDLGTVGALVKDSDDNIYVSQNVAANAVRKISPSGSILWTLSHTTGATGIARDSDGNIYVVYNTGDLLKKFDSNGNDLELNITIDAPSDVRVDQAGYIYISRTPVNSQLYKYDKFGNIIWSIPTIEDGGPWKIDIDSNGYVYTAHSVSAGKSLVKIDGARRYTVV